MYKKLSKYLLLFLMIMLPILDMTFFFSRVTTLVQIFLIFIILFLTLIHNKNTRKKIIYLLIYYFICLIYLGINYYRSIDFISLIPNNFNYSLYKEITTIIKLLIPITLLFILKYQNLSKKEYFGIINYWTLIITGTIIITNIFKISISSYSYETISSNIFDWINKPYYVYSASKGFFNYANQQSCILIMLLLMQTYSFFEKKKINLVYIILLCISMLMLGTRISSLGGILVLIFITIFYCVYKILKKEKQNKKNLVVLIPIVLWILLLPISPYSNRNIELNKDYSINEQKTIKEEYQKTDKENKANTIEKEECEKTDKEIKMEYIKENYNPDKLPEKFFEKYYSYEYDVDFWYDFVKKNNINDINYRMIEISIIDRVKEINNNKFDNYFGISNSRIQNIVNIERDWILHYYAYGLIGLLILLIIHPILLILLFKKILKTKKLLDIFILFALCLYILCSYLSGNILNFIITIIPLIFIVNGTNIEEA